MVQQGCRRFGAGQCRKMSIVLADPEILDLGDWELNLLWSLVIDH
jgi:hypothetical protein